MYNDYFKLNEKYFQDNEKVKAIQSEVRNQL